MAHMIENNMIAWKGAKPWHGLGFEVNENATGAEMLTIAGLDWKVQRRAIAMRPGDGSKDRMLTSQLDDYRAIVRSDNDTVFQVASNRYHPVQNAEIVEFFREYCEAGHAKMETVGGLRNGAVVWALARLNGGSTTTLAGGDELRGYMLLATSHDGSVKTIGKPTQVRVVCHNTLTAAFGEKNQQTFAMRHTRKFDGRAQSEAQRVMGMAIEQIKTTNTVADKLSKVTIDAAGRMEFLSKLLDNGGSVLQTIVNVQSDDRSLLNRVIDGDGPDGDENKLNRVGKAVLDAIIESPGSHLPSAEGTLWGAVNGVTWFADHVSKSRSDSNRMMSSWFGPNENLKNKALQVAVDMAGITVN
jgi:phage/plasmid-like protein (TIGR03299 family)